MMTTDLEVFLQVVSPKEVVLAVLALPARVLHVLLHDVLVEHAAVEEVLAALSARRPAALAMLAGAVALERRLVGVDLVAVLAAELPAAQVRPLQVLPQVLSLEEAPVAQAALVSPWPGPRTVTRPLVLAQDLFVLEGLEADVALVADFALARVHLVRVVDKGLVVWKRVSAYPWRQTSIINKTIA